MTASDLRVALGPRLQFCSVVNARRELGEQGTVLNTQGIVQYLSETAHRFVPDALSKMMLHQVSGRACERVQIEPVVAIWIAQFGLPKLFVPLFETVVISKSLPVMLWCVVPTRRTASTRSICHAIKLRSRSSASSICLHTDCAREHSCVLIKALCASI
jgi:hypothetical protein